MSPEETKTLNLYHKRVEPELISPHGVRIPGQRVNVSPAVANAIRQEKEIRSTIYL